MSDKHGTAIWRVTKADGSAIEHAFDALVIPSGRAAPQDFERHIDLSIPFEGKLTDVPLTLVVQAHAEAGPVIVEYQGFKPDGTLRLMGRSMQPLAVIVRTPTGISVAGLPGSAQ